MTGIGDRLRRKRIEKGFETAADAARAHGWNANTYRSHENEFRGVPRKWLLTYSKVFGVSLAWLTTGMEERRIVSASPAGREIPLIAWVDLPKTRGGVMSVSTVAEAETITTTRKVSKRAYGTDIMINDESMIDRNGSRYSLYPGDKVVIDENVKLRPGMIALIWDAHDKVHAVRRAEFASRTKVRFVAFNPIFPVIELPVESDYVIGVVVEIIRPAIPD